MSELFARVWTALWTPTDNQGRLLKEEIKSHIAFLRKSGVDGIVVGGSTGEFRRLTLQQRQELLGWVIQCAGPMPVIANISAENMEHLKILARGACEHQVAGVIVLPPSYYAIPQEDLVAYFKYVATLTEGLPFLLYNFPECIRNSIEAHTVEELADSIVLAGIKQSGNAFDYHKELVRVAQQKHFTVLTGSDTRLPEALKLGVKGSIGGLSNGVPELIVDVFYGSQNQQDVSASQTKLQQIAKIIAPLNFPYDVAALIQARGFEVGADKTIRSAHSLNLQAKVVAELKTLFAEWGF